MALFWPFCAVFIFLKSCSTRLAIALRDDRSNWLTVVKSTVDGTCLTDADSRIPITFGEDIRTGCFIR